MLKLLVVSVNGGEPLFKHDDSILYSLHAYSDLADVINPLLQYRKDRKCLLKEMQLQILR